MAVEVINNSSYIDFTGYRIVPAGTSVQAAYNMQTADIDTNPTNAHINVALILERANAATDPDVSLLSQNWAARQAALADQTTLWATYGADAATYQVVYNALDTAGYTILDSSNSYYVTSPESRTIWVQLDTAAQFNSLFSSSLQKFNAPESSPYDDFVFWNGDLSLPTEWSIAGIWFDTDNVPDGMQLTTVDTPTLLPGAQSIGNSTALTYNFPDGEGATSAPEAPQDIAAFYNFPLLGESIATGAIGLIEPGVGSYLGSSPDGVVGTDFQSRLDAYLASSQIGQTGTGQVTVQGINGQTEISGERSLDVGIVAAINPNSDIVLYNGSGQNTPASAGSGTGINGLPTTGYANASIFTAVQSSIWDPNYAAVTSNSWGDSQSMTPGSPFYVAYWELFIDAALRNQTTFIALGDGGSGNETSNGVTNVEYNVTQPYNILVGGTSLSSFDTAETDDTLNPGLYSLALAGDLSTIWSLVQGGMTTLPTDAASVQYFVETVWNSYYLQGDTITGEPNLYWDTGYYQNSTSSGGVDPTQPVPLYQQNYGLTPVTSDPLAETGRGVPDVAANAGGNLMYLVPTADMGGNDVATTPDDGTSSAAPLWASLGVQLNAVFADQGLPNLGYMNDLLYIASAIAPASFNDVLSGNNTSSFLSGGDYRTPGENSGYSHVTPTGYGYEAGEGYDLVSGLGTPNGLVLARTLTTIAHTQTYEFANSISYAVIDPVTGASTASQTLLVQNNFIGAGVVVQVDGTDAVSMGGNSAFAWTSRLAGQAVQGDNFDSDLMPLLDGAMKSAPYQIGVSAGALLGVTANGTTLDAYQTLLTSEYGFAQFGDAGGGITLARPVAIAQTAAGADDQEAVVRIRQNGGDQTQLEIYRVDDLNGGIDTGSGVVLPGQAGYAAAAAARDYQLVGGGTVIDAPGQTNFLQVEIADVDQGDIVALKYTNVTTGEVYWAFSQGNTGQASAIFAYGLNTWGFEDRPLTGDHDYQDLVVQLDFTSTAGSGLLVV